MCGTSTEYDFIFWVSLVNCVGKMDPHHKTTLLLMLNTTRCNTGHHGIKYWHNMAFFFFFFFRLLLKWIIGLFFFLRHLFFFNSFMSYKILFFRDLMLTAGSASWTVETLIASPKKRHLCLVLTVSETRCGPFPQHQFTLHTHKYKIVCCPPPNTT